MVFEMTIRRWAGGFVIGMSLEDGVRENEQRRGLWLKGSSSVRGLGFYVGLTALWICGGPNPGLRPGLGYGRAVGAKQGRRHKQIAVRLRSGSGLRICGGG